MPAKSLGLCAQMACILEVTARKAGNVHRCRDFPDLTYFGFLASAAAVAPVFEVGGAGLGETILRAVEATRQVVATNTNLGIILLLAPLVHAARRGAIRDKLPEILAETTCNDAALTYQAIRLASPGGLGKVPDQDVRSEPTQTLREVMTLAAGRDMVARQYAVQFADVLDEGTPYLVRSYICTGDLERAIQSYHLRLLASRPDTLIMRKFGRATAEMVSMRAREVFQSGWPETPQGKRAFADFDRWLFSARFNPGASADLTTACLFVALWEDTIPWPGHLPPLTGFDHG